MGWEVGSYGMGRDCEIWAKSMVWDAFCLNEYAALWKPRKVKPSHKTHLFKISTTFPKRKKKKNILNSSPHL